MFTPSTRTTPVVRRGAPACAWQCTHCSVGCATLTFVRRELLAERAKIASFIPEGHSDEQTAEIVAETAEELASVDRQLNAAQAALREAQAEALHAEFEAGRAARCAVKPEVERKRHTQVPAAKPARRGSVLSYLPSRIAPTHHLHA